MSINDINFIRIVCVCIIVVLFVVWESASGCVGLQTPARDPGNLVHSVQR